MARTTRLSDGLTEGIAAHVPNGSYLSKAAQRCGVSASGASDWFGAGLGTHPERVQTDLIQRFAESIQGAEAEHEVSADEYLSQHPDWRARMAVPQRCQRDKWGDASTETDQAAAALEVLAGYCGPDAQDLSDHPHPQVQQPLFQPLSDAALAITQELGMRPLTERILARREILRA